jgi:RNA polymerase sigma factor (sigma-70 family)
MKAILPFQTSDAALVRRALGDDPRAFEELVLRHQRKAHGFARALGVPPDAVDDVVQEAFLQAFRDLPGLREAESFGPWLLGIVRNVGLKTVQKARRTAATPLLDALDGAAAEDSLEGEDFREYLWRKVGELPEGVRQALFLYYHDGESVRDVARALGVSRAVVKNRLKKGRDILRERLWRRLEECLRDMLPSTRVWKQKARRLTLVATAAVPAAWALGAKAALAAGAAGGTASTAAGSAAASPLLKTFAGGFLMTGKKVVIAAAVAAVTLGAVFLITTRAFRGDAPSQGGQIATRDAARSDLAPGRSGEAGKGAGEVAGEAGSIPRAKGAAREIGPVSLRGRVVDPEGRPVDGARLVAIHLKSWQAIGKTYRDASLEYRVQSTDLKRLRDEYLRFGEAAPEARSGDDGAYAFRGLAEGDHRIVASHPEFLASVGSLAAIVPGAAAVADIELAPALSIAGKVLDESGAPVPAAAVRSEPSRVSAVQGTEKISRLVAAWEEGRILVEGAAVETGPDGSFRIPSLEPDLHDVFAVVSGRLEARAWSVPAGSGDIVLTLERGAAVAGRVLDPAMSPVAAAEVILSRAKPAEVHRIFDQRRAEVDLHGTGTRRASIDGKEAGGRFRIEGVEDGAYTLIVKTASFPLLVRDVEVAGNDADLGDLVLEEPRAISGTVYAPGRRPLEGARVWVPRLERSATPTNWLSLEPAEALAETKSGAGGRFTLSGIPGGTFEVRASAEGFADAAAAGIAASSSKVELLLAAGSILAGKVVDDEAGSPVEGARVKVGFRETKEAVSDGQGRFTIPGIPPSALHEGRGWINVSHPDFGQHSREVVVLGRDERSPIEVRLSRGGRIAGRVLGPEKEPVRGARVWFDVTGLPEDALGYNPARGLSAFSAEDGSFTIPAPGQLRGMIGDIQLFAVASHAAYSPARAGPIAFPRTGDRWQDIEIVLSRGIVIEGKVTDTSGRPVPGARVTARAPAAAGVDPTSPEAAGSTRSAFSGHDGSYRIRGAPPETFEVRARAIRHAAATVPVSPDGEEGATRVDIVLDPGASIEGRVVDSTGAPVPGAEVEAFPEGELPGEEIDDTSEFSGRMARWSAIGFASARSGPDGGFRLEHLPGAPFTLLARAAGFEPEIAAGARPGGAAVDVVLGRYSAIRGAVLAADSREPVTWFQVNVVNKAKRDALVKSTNIHQRQLGTEGELRFTDPAGRFFYDGLRPGDYEVTVGAPGFLPRRLDAEVRASEELPLEVLLERGARVEGVVIDAETGAPVAGATIHAWRQDRQPDAWMDMSEMYFRGAETTSREDGSFVKEGLADGKYAFDAAHPLYANAMSGGGAALEMAEVARGTVTRVEIRLRPAGSIEGTIRGLVRERKGNREVRYRLVILPAGEKTEKDARDPSAAWRNQIYLDPSGSFQKSNILPGKYAIELKKQAVEEGRPVSVGPMGGFGTSNPAGPEETFPLGEIEIVAGRVVTFDAAAPGK